MEWWVWDMIGFDGSSTLFTGSALALSTLVLAYWLKSRKIETDGKLN